MNRRDMLKAIGVGSMFMRTGTVLARHQPPVIYHWGSPPSQNPGIDLDEYNLRGVPEVQKSPSMDVYHVVDADGKDWVNYRIIWVCTSGVIYHNGRMDQKPDPFQVTIERVKGPITLTRLSEEELYILESNHDRWRKAHES